MNRVLRKRLKRDIKSNFGRYLALFLMIVMGMYIIVGMVGAAETVISQTAVVGIKNNVEDGEFSVFLTLTEQQKAELTESGIDIEEMFGIDIENENGAVLRLMKNRNKINLNTLDSGRLAEKDGEVVLEKRYCEENGISVGDAIKINNIDFFVTGIGSTPDYDAPIAKMSDTAESSMFGLAFVTSEQYEKIKADTSLKAEEYTYAYKLNGKMTDDELKSKIKAFEFDYNDVKDKYFKETIADTIGRKDDLQNGINELLDGANELRDGLSELDENSMDLNNGVAEIFNAYLAQASSSLNTMGISETLTSENYSEILEKYIVLTDSADLKSLKEMLDGLNTYVNGTVDYTNGVSKAYDGSDELADGIKELETETDKVIDEFFDVDIDNLTSFVKASENPRIAAAAGDMYMNKVAGLVAGVIVMILFTYVISVFVIHQIQRESSVIGTLYALGAKKNDLIMHYITLPTAIALIGGIIGAVLGFSELGINTQMQDCYEYFSIPDFETVYPVYLIIYSVVMPPLISAIVNYFVINKHLSQTALSLIKNEQNTGSYSRIDLGNTGFIRRFQIRQLLREMRTGFTVAFGMIICLMIFMLGADCYVLCNNIKVQNKADTTYEYMYTLKYPENNTPENGEAVYSKSLSKTYLDYTLDVNIMGIDSDNKYFDVTAEKGKSSIIIGSSVAQKYGLKVGDKLILTDSANDMDYAFTVDGVADYSVGLTAFMDIDSMRELFGEDDNFYNVLLSDVPLDIDEGRLHSVTTREDISRSADIFVKLMIPMVIMLTAVSVIIFCVVMFLMLGVMIDRSSFGISLMKIFGFRIGEVKKLYLNGNTFTIAVGAIIGIPLAKKLVDSIFPWMIANTNCGMDLAFTPLMYFSIFIGIMVVYFVINAVLVGKLKKISPAEILKNRE